MGVSLSIDLHGCSVPEAMRQFVDFYNDCIRNGNQGFIEVIHGYGSSGTGGTIQQELRRYLAANSDRLEMHIAGDSVGNPGITKVYPKRLLPIVQNAIGAQSTAVREAILRLCQTPKAKEKILLKLRGRFGDSSLREELSRLIRDGLLHEVDGKLES
jgi:hypothetical protein